MSDQDDRRFEPSETDASRTRMQGGGVGAREMDQQRDPDRSQTAASPEPRSFAADSDLDGATNADRPQAADFGDTDLRAANGGGIAGADGLEATGDLGVGTPANVDIHNLGQEDRPQEDWGEPAPEGTVFSSNHGNRGGRTELERGQGAKTRAANKDIFSRRL